MNEICFNHHILTTIAGKFLTDYNGIADVTKENNKLSIVKSLSNKFDFVQIRNQPGVYLLEFLYDEN